MDILLIDDDDDVRRVLARVLTRDGHQVREAAHGKAALAAMRERAAAVVLSDVYMPEMDGIELLRELHRAYPGTRIIIMTGGGNMGRADLLGITTALGAAATLAKPILPDALRAALESPGEE